MQAEALRTFLDRLDTDVTKPFDVLSLPKADHLGSDGSVKNEEALLEAIEDIPKKSPQFAALLDWERRVLRATGRTVSSILDLAAGESTGERPKIVGRVLSRLAIEAVGANNVEADPLRAVNEALLPILADRISALRSSGSHEEIWSEALESLRGLPTLSHENTARLNSLIHIAEPDTAATAERGIVVGLPSRYRRRFERCFGISEKDAAAKEFRCTQFDKADDQFCWVLVQCRGRLRPRAGKIGHFALLPWTRFPNQAQEQEQEAAGVHLARSGSSPTRTHSRPPRERPFSGCPAAKLRAAVDSDVPSTRADTQPPDLSHPHPRGPPRDDRIPGIAVVHFTGPELPGMHAIMRPPPATAPPPPSPAGKPRSQAV